MDRRQFLGLAGAAPALLVPRRSAAQAARSHDTRAADLEALVRERMADYRVPGVGLGLWQAGRLHVQGFGVTSVDDGQPVTADTLFTVASITKTMTATAALRLVETGRLDLQAPIRAYLPGFRVLDDEASQRVSTWHLLTHTPGWEGQLTTEDRGAEALAHFVAEVMPGLPQLAAPGEVWSYNNAGFALCGRVIEAITGRGIHDALRELVFGPLGLVRTTTRLTDAMTRPLTLGHRERDGRTEVIRPFQTTSSTTAGGALTSVNELIRYARFHLGPGTAADGGLHISRARLELMQTAQLRKHGTDDGMGIGWHVRRVGGTTTLAHGGTLNGHCLLVQLVPDRELAFTVLTNHVDGWRLVQDVEAAILQAFAGVALAPGQRIAHRGVNEAMTRHARALERQPDPAPYVGEFERPPVGRVEVRRDGDRLVVVTGAGQPDAPIAFYGEDVAFALRGAYTGMPYEFVRDARGVVRWIRVNGRIARRVSDN